MAVSTQFKVNQLAKNLGIKAKDLSQLFVDEGLDVKTQKTLDTFELDVMWEKLTRDNQLEGIEDYIDGVTGIPSVRKKAEEAPSAAAKNVAAEKTADNSARAKETAVPAAPKANAATPENSAKPVKEAGKVLDAKALEGLSPIARQNLINRSAGQRFEQRMNAAKAQPVTERADKDKKKEQKKDHQRTVIEVKGRTIPEGEREVVKVPAKQTTRVVDTRGTGEKVDLSKYDEKLDNFVPDTVKETRNGKAKANKKVGADAQQGQAQQKGGKQNGKAPDRRAGAPAGNVANGAQARRNNRNFRDRRQGNAQPAPVQIKKQPVQATVPDEITVGEFASRIKVTAAEVVKKLMLMGMMVTVNQTIDFDTAYLIGEELGAIVTREVVVSIEDRLFEEEEDKAEDLVPRAPVVCVMGHVDHGKTSLLDAIRNTRVTAGEAGGITQHIGAYRVKLDGKDITFLDTPGHEAFTAMRARGAQATDIAILVVAADDGIMPQTVEAINHAKAAGVEIIVAINKMDKPTANPDNIKQELTKYDLVPEEWGGNVMCVPVSALKHQGIDDLLESILLIAEVNEYKANPNRRAKGLVIESKLDKGRGPVATVLVQNGTLHNGDIVIAGTSVGRVRAMTDHLGKSVKVASPSTPVEIIGLSELPSAGDEFNAVADERMARELADQRREKAKEETFKANARANLNDLFAQISDGVKEMNVIVKADVAGSAEAVRQSLEKLSNEEVKVHTIHSAAGGITENDVSLAAASNAIIVGFNVRPDRSAIESAERQGVDIRTYRVIYDCINEIESAMKGMLAPKFRENLLGHVEVRQLIHVPNVGFVAGSYVQDGKITRSSKIRVVRDGIVIYEDKIASLRRFKDDVREVAAGYECGVVLEKYGDLKTGDILEAFVMEEIRED